MRPRLSWGRVLTHSILVAGVFVCALIFVAPSAQADIIRGVKNVIAGVLEIPLSTLAGTFNGPPIIGTLMGALSGTFNGIGLAVEGAFDLAVSGIDIAKTVGPYLIPIFL